MMIPRSLTGFDVNAAVGRMLDRPELWWEALGLFVEHFADWESSWRGSVGDDALERKRVHALRSGAVNVGALDLAEVAGTLEAVLLKRAAGQMAEVPAGLRERLQDCFCRTWTVAASARREQEGAWRAQG